MGYVQYHQHKKKRSSYDLSLLTPYIILQPRDNCGPKQRKKIRQAVKSVNIAQDSDIVQFNKVTAQVQFAPLETSTGYKQDKFNYMDIVKRPFNQGSIWTLRTGWSGPVSLANKKLYNQPGSDYKQCCTLHKMNLQLINGRYSGTLQFSRYRFQALKDAPIPFDRVITAFDNDKTKQLKDDDYILDGDLMNQLMSGKGYDKRLEDTVKINQQKRKQIQDLNSKINQLNRRKNSSANRQLKDKSNIVQKWIQRLSDAAFSKQSIVEKLDSYQKQQNDLFSVKWCTARYLVTVLSALFQEPKYKIFVNSQSLQQGMTKNQNQNWAPVRVQKISRQQKLKEALKSHILHVSPNIDKIGRYLDYKKFSSPQFRTFNQKGYYVFNDSGDVLIDLYSFNKKVYSSNVLQRLAKINDFKMTGYPDIKISFDNISSIGLSVDGQVISILWSYPQSPIKDQKNVLTLTYDSPNQLFNNFKLQMPTNNQMLKIKQTNYAPKVQQLSIRLKANILNSFKKIIVPINKNSQHMNIKIRMYSKLVQQMMQRSPDNGQRMYTKQYLAKRLKDHKNIANRVSFDLPNGSKAYLFYFSSSQSFVSYQQMTKSNLTADQKKQFDDLQWLQKRMQPDSKHGDISGRLINYIANSMKISFDIHGLFGINVFRDQVICRKFPGPASDRNGISDPKNRDNSFAHYVNGTYIIIGQSTKVDRKTITTTIKRNRLPQITIQNKNVTDDDNSLYKIQPRQTQVPVPRIQSRPRSSTSVRQ